MRSIGLFIVGLLASSPSCEADTFSIRLDGMEYCDEGKSSIKNETAFLQFDEGDDTASAFSLAPDEEFEESETRNFTLQCFESGARSMSCFFERFQLAQDNALSEFEGGRLQIKLDRQGRIKSFIGGLVSKNVPTEDCHRSLKLKSVRRIDG